MCMKDEEVNFPLLNSRKAISKRFLYQKCDISTKRIRVIQLSTLLKGFYWVSNSI